MALLALAVVVVAFVAMAIVFGLQERADRRRMAARADAAQEREASLRAPPPDTRAQPDPRVLA